MTVFPRTGADLLRAVPSYQQTGELRRRCKDAENGRGACMINFTYVKQFCRLASFLP